MMKKITYTMLAIIAIFMIGMLDACSRKIAPQDSLTHTRDTIKDTVKIPFEGTVPPQTGKITVREFMNIMQNFQGGTAHFKTDHDSISVKVDTQYIYVETKPITIHDTIEVPNYIVVDSTKQQTVITKEVKVSPWWANTILGAAIALALIIIILLWMILRKR